MAVFRDAVITDAGKEATEKLIVSTGTLQFTGFAVGTGTYTKAEKEEASLKEMTSLKKLLKVYDVNSITKKDGIVILKSIIENTDFTSSHSITEIGLVANDGENDILYSIAVAENPLNIPGYNGVYTYTVTQEAYVAISRDLNVTIERPGEVYALAEDLETYVKDLSFDKASNTLSMAKGDGTKKEIQLYNIKSEIALLAAGQTSVVFNFDGGTIGENSRISLEASVPDLNYENITVDGDNVTVTFEAQERDVYVKAVVSDGLV